MCVLAAYLGPEPAAPILLDMLAREEGLGGGYYTGVATVHEGRLHVEKTVGDVAALRRDTAVEDMPGTLGIAHSRTPSGGDREWSHPFTGNEGTLAYVANGAMGSFQSAVGEIPRGQAFGNMLLDKGYRFRSATIEAIGPYPVLANGQCVHFSEIMCLLIEDHLRASDGLLQAAARAYQEYPAEIVGLTISTAEADSFVAMRINQPLVIGRGDGAVCAATTSLAFPPDMPWHMALPPLSAARITRDHMELLCLNAAIPAAAMPAPDAVLDLLMPALREDPQSIGGLCQLTAPLWPEGKLPQKAMLVYETLAALVEADKIELITERVPGMNGSGTVPATKVRLKHGF